MRYDSRKLSGITLLELMITVAIVGILASIAYPSYRAAVLRSHRTDARAALIQDAQTLEKSFTMNGNYTNSGLTLPHSSNNGYYTIDKSGAITAGAYALTATAIGPQADDTHCAVFQVTNTGDHAGTTNTDCWSK